MRKLLSLILALPLLAQAAHVQFFPNDASLAGIVTNRQIIVTPITNLISGVNIISGDSIKTNQGTNVSVTISNLVYGDYQVDFVSKSAKTSFTILVPETNALLNATGLVTSVVSVPGANAGYTQAAADARFSLIFTNPPMVFVSTNGNDSTAIRGRIDRPSLTLSNAKWLSVAGDSIRVFPGVYRDNDLAKNLVNWGFDDGAKVHYTNRIDTTAKAIFDDNGEAMEFSVSGHGEFIFEGNQSGVTPSENINGQIVWLKNTGSKVHFHAKRCANAPLVNIFDWDPGLIVITACSYFVGDIDLLEDNVTRGSRGIVWQSGNAEIDVKRISIYYYPIQLVELLAGAGNTKCTIRAGRIESLNFNPAIDTAVSSGAFSFHLSANEISSQDNHANSGGLRLTGGNTDIHANKLLCTNGVTPAIYVAGGAHKIWVGNLSANLIANVTAGVFVRVTGGVLDLSCPVFEPSGVFTGDGILVSGGTFNYHGFGRLSVLNGQGIVHSGGTSTIQGLRIDTTNTDTSTNRPVAVSSSGLRLHDCLLISPSSVAESVYAASAQTIICKDVAAVVAKHANVIVNGEAILVNSAFR